MKLILNDVIESWKLTGLIGKGGRWFLGYSKQNDTTALFIDNELSESVLGRPVPLDLLDDLIENTIECLNHAINSNADDYVIRIYQKEIERCEKIQRGK